MVLAEHSTPAKYGLIGRALETVTFVRPGLVAFRLARGPVAGARETHVAHSWRRIRARLRRTLETDLWSFGQWCGAAGRSRLLGAVAQSIARIRAEGKRRAEELSTMRGREIPGSQTSSPDSEGVR